MHWLLLFVAILFEVIATTAMKLSDGFSKLAPSVVTVVGYIACFTAFSFSLKQLDVSVAYAVWSGLGTALIAVIGFIMFNEQLSAMKLCAIALIIAGVVMLNLTGKTA